MTLRELAEKDAWDTHEANEVHDRLREVFQLNTRSRPVLYTDEMRAVQTRDLLDKVIAVLTDLHRQADHDDEGMTAYAMTKAIAEVEKLR